MSTLPPQHTLRAYGVALRLLRAVLAANIADAEIRNQATRAAKRTALNCAEGAGRVSRADKARVFAIARGECVEACGAVEIARDAGDTSAEAYAAVESIACELYAMLTKLVRH